LRRLYKRLHETPKQTQLRQLRNRIGAIEFKQSRALKGRIDHSRSGGHGRKKPSAAARKEASALSGQIQALEVEYQRQLRTK
jgi:hypothetical protein